MEYSSAEMICVLKVNIECEACKEKVMHVLQKVHGVYNIIIDGEEGIVKVNGRVNPNILLSVLKKSGKHAEIKYVKLDGEVVERNYNYNNYGEYGYNPYDNMQYCPYPPPLPCHQYQRYHHPYSYNHYQPHPPPPHTPPPPSPVASMSHQFPPPPPPGPMWEPPQSQPPPPPSMSGNRPSPSRSVRSFQNLPAEETSSKQNKPNKCSIM